MAFNSFFSFLYLIIIALEISLRYVVISETCSAWTGMNCAEFCCACLFTLAGSSWTLNLGKSKFKRRTKFFLLLFLWSPLKEWRFYLCSWDCNADDKIMILQWIPHKWTFASYAAALKIKTGTGVSKMTSYTRN